jgi:hypothetical protein
MTDEVNTTRSRHGGERVAELLGERRHRAKRVITKARDVPHADVVEAAFDRFEYTGGRHHTVEKKNDVFTWPKLRWLRRTSSHVFHQQRSLTTKRVCLAEGNTER